MSELTYVTLTGKYLFADRYAHVPVIRVTGGTGNFAAYVYQCILNLDIDGAPKTYGLNNPAAKNSQGGENLQKDLDPLESWHKGQKGVSLAYSQAVGLGNAAGDPGDGTKGWKNYAAGNRKFYWAGLKAVTRAEAGRLNLVIDARPQLEAGMARTLKKGEVLRLLPVGLGYFPVVQKKGGTAEGYFISTTSVVSDGSLDQYDPKRYLNSEKVAYTVWANNWLQHNIAGKSLAQGDFGLAIRNDNGHNIGYVYGDSGTPNKVGESSLKLHNEIGGGSGLVTFIAFPGSGTGKVLGKDPETTLQFKVWMKTLRLAPNARELATRIALGKDMALPRKQVELNPNQARVFDQVYGALRKWTTLF